MMAWTAIRGWSWRIALLVLSMAAGHSALAVEPQANLLPNGSFEQWADDSRLPVGWRLLAGHGPSMVHRDTQIAHEGASALRIDFSASHFMCWPGTQVDGIKPDTEYRLSGWARTTEDFKAPVIINVEPNLGGTELKPGPVWTRFEVTINSQEAQYMVLGLRLRGQGSVWVDGMELVQVGEAGQSVLPERRQLLDLIAFQNKRVPDSANTDDWTRSFVRAEDPGQVFGSDAAQRPAWAVGQWVRYLCHDQWLVPSNQPQKRPVVALVDCAIVGQEQIAGKTYYWYQSVVRLNKYWVAQSSGRYETGQKILLDQPRQVVISMLVDGPEFREVARYQLKVDGEPLLEFADDRGAVLPGLNIDHALIRPWVSGSQSAGNPGSAPVTGLLTVTQHQPHLDREARLVNWGLQGAVDQRQGEEPTIVRLQARPYITISFDGFGELSHYKEMLAAGAGAFHHLNISYLGEIRGWINTMPAYFSNTRRWDVDVFDTCRSNFLGFTPHLDEPYQRQRKTAEYIKPGQTTDLVETADRYSAALSRYAEHSRLWPGQRVYDYNCPAPAAWYSARAGADGFILENARMGAQMTEVAAAIGQTPPPDFIRELNIAAMRGPARHFGGAWGQGIYRWTANQYWQDDLVYFAQRGADYLGFWVDGDQIAKDPELKFYQQVLAVMPDVVAAIKKTQPKPVKATALILVPNGYILGFAGSDPAKPWGIIDHPQGQQITQDTIRQAYEWFKQGIAFDIAVDDPRHPIDASQYQQVVRVKQ